MRLVDKNVVITGGGSGIGKACAYALAEEGCRVLIGGRNRSKLEDAIRGRSDLSQISSHVLDVSDRSSVSTFFLKAREKFGGIDMLVNAAGINIPNRTMEALAPEDWDRIMAINATGSYNCIHAVLPSMLERGNGLIVNISSVAGKRAGPLGGVAYNAAKFAQTALGISVGAEMGERGVRVTNIYPGEVDTPILKDRPQPLSDEHRSRILQPEDVAAAVLLVACLPARANVPELVIAPTSQTYV